MYSEKVWKEERERFSGYIILKNILNHFKHYWKY